MCVLRASLMAPFPEMTPSIISPPQLMTCDDLCRPGSDNAPWR
jgi:hypothetical protein